MLPMDPRDDPKSTPHHEVDAGTDPRDVDALFNSTYAELRRLARCIQRGDRGGTLSPTALVNEAWLKLAGSRAPAVHSPLHFKRIAARAMRQVLIEAARRRTAQKRGGGAALVTFDEGIAGTIETADDLLGLDAALKELARVEPRRALMVEYRFFGGLDVPETALALGVSEATVVRDWRTTRAWLAKSLRRDA